jgi:hypothetical protein
LQGEQFLRCSWKYGRQVCVYIRTYMSAEHNEWPLKMLQFGESLSRLPRKIDRARDNAAPAPARRRKNTHHQVRNDGLQRSAASFLC